ncbi:MAG: alpha/beta fold hydrolase [Pseudomonadota bacterium]
MRLAHEIYGLDGARETALLIAHGVFGSARNWGTLARRFSAGRPVVAVDMRNHGDSGAAEEMSYPSMGDDLLETAAALFERPALLLGHSMGGKAAMAAALRAPDAVAGLIVADIAPVAYVDGQLRGYLDAMRALPLDVAGGRAGLAAQLEAATPNRAIRDFLLSNVAFDRSGPTPTARWRLNLDGLSAGVDDVVGWPDALSERRYDGPTLFIHGGASDYVSAEGRARATALFPNAVFETLGGAGHWLHAEQPDAFFARVSAWLEGR